jgi:hypothetical protein
LAGVFAEQLCVVLRLHLTIIHPPETKSAKVSWANEGAKKQRGQPQLNYHHEGHEDHEEKSCHLSSSILRVLRALRGEKVLSEMSDFGILHCKDAVARAGSEFGPMSNAHHLVGRATKGKFLLASSRLSAFALKFFCPTAWKRLS